MRINLYFLIFISYIVSFNIIYAQTGNTKDLYQKASDLKFSKKYEEAITIYNQVLEADHQYYDAYYQIGVCQYNLAKYEDALQSFRWFVKRDDKNVDALNYIGISLIGLEKYEEAIKELNKAILANQKYYLPYYNRGVCYYNLKKHDLADKDFDKAIEFNSRDYKYDLAYFNLGCTYNAMGDLLSSCKFYKIAEKLGYIRAEAYVKQDCDSTSNDIK